MGLFGERKKGGFCRGESKGCRVVKEEMRLGKVENKAEKAVQVRWDCGDLTTAVVTQYRKSNSDSELRY